MKKFPKGHKPGCLCRACKGVRGEFVPSEQLGIRITPEMMTELRERASSRNSTVTEVATEALRLWLEATK